MNVKRAHEVYPVTVVILIIFFYTFVAWRSLWGFVLQIAQTAPFGDLRVVTSAAGCYNGIASIDFVGNSCTNWLALAGGYPAEPYNYPAFWARALATIGVSDKSLSLLGILFIFIFAISTGILVKLATEGEKTLWSPLILLILSFSPASILALERGNFDVLAYSTVVFGTYLAVRGKPIAAGFVLAAASVLKIFPTGSFGVVVASSRRRKTAILVFATTLFVGSLLVVGDIPQILSRTPQSSQASFGISVLPLAAAKILGFTLSNTGARLIGFALFLAFIVIILMLEHNSQSSFSRWSKTLALQVALDRNSKSLILAGLGTFSVAYLLGANWDYRAIFLIIAAAGFSRLATSLWGQSWPILALVSLAILNTAQGGDHLFNFLGDGILLPLAPFFVVLILRVLRIESNRETLTLKKNSQTEDGQ